jgi:hypothetical protein
MTLQSLAHLSSSHKSLPITYIYHTSPLSHTRPKEGERLILWLRDLNLPKPDAYDTIQLIAFLQQLITYQGFYNDDLEWIGIERVQIVGSMNPATTVGRSQLSTRFTAITNVVYIDYPNQQQLQVRQHTHARTHTHTHTHTHAHTHTHMHMHTHTHAHTCTHMHTHAHTRTDIHTHTHTISL